MKYEKRCLECGEKFYCYVNSRQYCSRKCMFNSEVYKNKISDALIGHSVSKETRKKISEKNAARKNGMYGKRGDNHPNYGRKVSAETRRKISKWSKKWHESNPHPRLGKKHSLETRKKISEIQKGKKQPPELVEKRARKLRGKTRPPFSKKWRENISKSVEKLWADQGYRKRMCKNRSEVSKRLCKNADYYNKTLGIIAKPPTRPELIFNKLTPAEVEYVGNRKWWRKLPSGKYKNPDFKVRGQNKVIEVFGNYWHRNDDPQELIDLYKTTGLDCLVIWEKEIYENLQEVFNKTIDFISA